MISARAAARYLHPVPHSPGGDDDDLFDLRVRGARRAPPCSRSARRPRRRPRPMLRSWRRGPATPRSSRVPCEPWRPPRPSIEPSKSSYASSPEMLRLTTARGVRVEILAAGPTGWQAKAAHQDQPGRSCVIFVGRVEGAESPRTDATGKWRARKECPSAIECDSQAQAPLDRRCGPRRGRCAFGRGGAGLHPELYQLGGHRRCRGCRRPRCGRTRVTLGPAIDTADAIGDTIQLAAVVTDSTGTALMGVAPAWTTRRSLDRHRDAGGDRDGGGAGHHRDRRPGRTGRGAVAHRGATRSRRRSSSPIRWCRSPRASGGRSRVT